jgi:hypothetical protein
VVVFEPDIDLLLDLLVDTEKKATLYEIYLFSKWQLFIVVNKPTPWSRILLEKLTVIQQVTKFPAFNGRRKFVTMFKKPCH